MNHGARETTQRLCLLTFAQARVRQAICYDIQMLLMKEFIGPSRRQVSGVLISTNQCGVATG